MAKIWQFSTWLNNPPHFEAGRRPEGGQKQGFGLVGSLKKTAFFNRTFYFYACFRHIFVIIFERPFLKCGFAFPLKKNTQKSAVHGKIGNVRSSFSGTREKILEHG